MCYWFERIYIWCCRWSHSRGFGVQSPWAYHFIRYVVNEHYPYYAYDFFRVKYAKEGRRKLKLGRFFFRLANALQPSVIVEFDMKTNTYQDFFHSGCKKSQVIRLKTGFRDSDYEQSLAYVSHVDIVRIAFVPQWRDFLDVALSKRISSSVFIFQDIYKSKENLRFWNDLIQDERVGITFDLYYCGIAFFDKTMIKQHYFINF